MKLRSSLPLAIAAAIALSACSQNARDQSAQAGNAIAADVSATTDNTAVDMGSAGIAVTNGTADTLSNTGENIEATADKLGSAISNGADKAADATGNVLEQAGKKLKD